MCTIHCLWKIKGRGESKEAGLITTMSLKCSVAWFLVFGGVCKGHLPVPSCQFDLCSRNHKIRALHYCLQVPLPLPNKMSYSLHNSPFRHCTACPKETWTNKGLLLCASLAIRSSRHGEARGGRMDKQSPVFFPVEQETCKHWHFSPSFIVHCFLSDFAPLSSIGHSIHLPEPY